jgi:hypothetical protein
MSTKVDKHQYRFKVPKSYDVINDWVDCQVDLSTSLFLLINEYVRENGVCDVMSASTRNSVEESSTTVVKKKQPKKIKKEVVLENKEVQLEKEQDVEKVSEVFIEEERDELEKESAVVVDDIEALGNSQNLNFEDDIKKQELSKPVMAKGIMDDFFDEDIVPKKATTASESVRKVSDISNSILDSLENL